MKYHAHLEAADFSRMIQTENECTHFNSISTPTTASWYI